MSFSVLLLSNKPGFLLMEALLALLLFSGFSVVIGIYWHHLSFHQKNADLRLQALSSALDVVDQLLLSEKDFGTLQKSEQTFGVTVDTSFTAQPHLIKGTLKTMPDTVQLARVTVALPSEQIQLITIVPGRQ